MRMESNHGFSGSKRNTPDPNPQLVNHHHIDSLLTSERSGIDYVFRNGVCKLTSTTIDGQLQAFLLKKITNYVIDFIEDNELSSSCRLSKFLQLRKVRS
jgi:hypothetical protein